MTNLTNYHSHCLYCDGRANMEDFIRFAISEGFSSYGISSHAPLPFSTAWTMEWDRMDDYLSEFSRLKGKYADKIELAIGLEIDYLNEESHPAIPRFQELPLDYRIGSVHMLYFPQGKVVDIDAPADIFRQLIDAHFEGIYKSPWLIFVITGKTDKVCFGSLVFGEISVTGSSRHFHPVPVLWRNVLLPVHPAHDTSPAATAWPPLARSFCIRQRTPYHGRTLSPNHSSLLGRCGVPSDSLREQLWHIHAMAVQGKQNVADSCW